MPYNYYQDVAYRLIALLAVGLTEHATASVLKELNNFNLEPEERKVLGHIIEHLKDHFDQE